MNRNILLLIFLISLVNHFTANAQQSATRKVIQFSGVVMSSDSLEALPFAAIFDKNTNKGTYSNLQGFFSFSAYAGDTVIFSFIGYQKRIFDIPKNLTEDRYSIIQLLTEDTVYLPITVIRPYPKPEEFKTAFINLQLPDDDLDRAAKNLEKMNNATLNLDLAMDGQENQQQYFKNYAQSYYYKGQAPPQGIFNMAAWNDFLTAWKRGDFKKKKKYY